jgi:NAD-dependent dihydropyrimidine dehydrogenase PreA subunit
MLDWKVFYEQFGVWPAARAYSHLMFDEQEVKLILTLGGRALTVDALALALHIEPAAARALAEQGYHRLLLNKEGEGADCLYRATDFYTFVDHFIKYERWDEIPLEARRALDRQYRDGFVARVREGVALTLAGQVPPASLPNEAMLLLPEVEAMVEAATDLAVEPCDCRRAGQYCERPVETCLRLDEGAREARRRGHGRSITKAEAKEILRQADKKGLMHTADSEWHARGLHSICNCCACDCYPIAAAIELGSKGVWPKIRYVADYDSARCTFCGTCVRRCHFGAFFHDGATVLVNGQARAGVAFDPQECWGCGLCANTCPAEAIAMRPLG